MNHPKQILLLAVCGLSLSLPCMAQKKKPSALKKASWLIGTWENKTKRGSIYEAWMQKDDSTLAGRSYMIKGTDTMTVETISLEQRNGVLSYIPTMSNQNEGKPVPFKLTAASGDALVFENPEHDFPKKITYTRLSAGSLMAEISGPMNGQEKAIKFPMTKVQ